METFELHIKNMVCSRCTYIVESELKVLGIKIVNSRLGHVTVQKPNSVSEKEIEERLKKFEFEILKLPEEILIEEAKLSTLAFLQFVELERKKEIPELVPLSEFMSNRIGKNYSVLSKAFSKQENKTIEQYYIRLRIERVKELLDDGEFNLSQIASKLAYSSVQYLSTQFKKVTGMAVREYKEKIDEVGRESIHKL